MREDVPQVRASGGKLVPQVIHVDVAPVADDQLVLRIEHGQALPHVVDRSVQAIEMHVNLGLGLSDQGPSRLGEFVHGLFEGARQRPDFVGPLGQIVPRTALRAAGLPNPDQATRQPENRIDEIPLHRPEAEHQRSERDDQDERCDHPGQVGTAPQVVPRTGTCGMILRSTSHLSNLTAP